MSPAGRILITTFGLGHMRPASGTWGSLPPVALAGAMWALNVSPTGLLWHSVLLCICVLFAIVCVAFGAQAEERFGHDPKEVVADETSGMCLPLMLLPASAFASTPRVLGTLTLAFVLFRILDIIKPWPAHGLQRQPGGWGILLDDLFAGLYAFGLMQLATRVLVPMV